jgi:D-lactate dehydrogenase
MHKLLTPQVARLGRPDVPPETDAVDPSFSDGTPELLKADLIDLLGESQVLSRVIDLVRFASDASPYRYIPQVVVRPKNIGDVQKIFRYCTTHKRHATFRGGGTSLCGQSQSDDILIDVRHDWNQWQVLDEGQRFKAHTGTLLGHANEALAAYQMRLGPDPASAHAATLGGVLSNNAGGMRCSLPRDSYHTVESMTVVLPSGTVIDTAAPGAEEEFAKKEPALSKGLMDLRNEILADPEFVERIKRRYSHRNTNGYGIRSFLDGETALGILRRIMIGSEGTLGFVGEVVYKAIPLPRLTTVAWLPFATVGEAVAVVNGLVTLGAEAVEMMVASTLTIAAKSYSGTPSYWKTLDPQAAALLVEFGASDEKGLDEIEEKVRQELSGVKMLEPLSLMRDEKCIELAWHVREGLLGLMGRSRPKGTAILTEDVCFPPDRLKDAAEDLTDLLNKYKFDPAVVGHAAYGNVHFSLVVNLSVDEDKQRYASFMDEMTSMVVDKYDGSLKAEHGTGINMAPFVQREWGEKAYGVMRRIKTLFDPEKVLAPNVLLSDDPQIHLKKLKSTPQIENISEASHCIECGFCEPVCPSRNVTTTPRQRIALRREMARQEEWSPLLRVLLEQYEYLAIETCAADGTCADVCPIDINTGALMKHFRKIEHTPEFEKAALEIAKEWGEVERLARLAIGTADIVQQLTGTGLLTGVTDIARSVVSNDLIPSVPGPMPHAAPAVLPSTAREGASAAYFPACVNRIFGRDVNSPKTPSLPEVLVTLSSRARKPLWIPDDVRGLCCSTPWSSKGYKQGGTYMAEQVVDAFWRWSEGGKLPIVVDAASCTLGMMEDAVEHLDVVRKQRLGKVQIFDSIQWCAGLLPDLTITHKLDSIIIHPTCSTTHLGLNDTLKKLAAEMAQHVEVPIGTTCCGTAGDRGLLHPELVHTATRDAVVQINLHPAQRYISANRTCEIGMHQATGKPYESFAFTLEELTRPKA